MKYNCDVGPVEVVMVSGAVVRCRPVPPYSYDVVIGEIQEPKFPYVDVGTKEVGIERRPALRDTPEWEEYQIAHVAYRVEMTKAITAHKLQYGIVDWKYPGMDEFAKMPPDGWVVPSYLAVKHGVKTAEDAWERRLQFIRYTLIATDADDDTIGIIINGPKSSSVTTPELENSLVPFDSSDGTEQPKSQ